MSSPLLQSYNQQTPTSILLQAKTENAVVFLIYKTKMKLDTTRPITVVVTGTSLHNFLSYCDVTHRCIYIFLYSCEVYINSTWT